MTNYCSLGDIAGDKLAAVIGGTWAYFDTTTEDWVDIGTVGTVEGESTIFRGKTVYVNGDTGGGYCYEDSELTRLDNMP